MKELLDASLTWTTLPFTFLLAVVGLLVALPSAIGYNVLSDWIRKLSVGSDNFAQEVVADIERYYAM